MITITVTSWKVTQLHKTYKKSKIVVLAEYLVIVSMIIQRMH